MNAYRLGAALALTPILTGCSAHPAHTSVTAPVTVSHARLRPVPTIVSAIGRITRGASPVITATHDGRVTAVLVHPGESVRAGETLARLQRAGNASARGAITAPVSARVTRILIRAGMRIRRGQRLFGLQGPAIREARAPFLVRPASALTVGQRVWLHSPLAPRAPVRGTIVTINQTRHKAFDTERHALNVVIALPPLQGFAPRSPVRVDAVLGVQRALTVPAKAVVLRARGTVVFVLHHGRARMQTVHVRARTRRWAVLASGLRPGTPVVGDPDPTLATGRRVVVGKG